MAAPITKLFGDAVQVLGPTDPGIMRLQQDSPQMGDAVLLLLLSKHSLVIITASRLDLAFGALKQLLDVVRRHVEVGRWGGWYWMRQWQQALSKSQVRGELQLEPCNLDVTLMTETEGSNGVVFPGEWDQMRGP